MSEDSAGRTVASGTQPPLPPFAGRCLTEWMRTIDEEAPGLLLAAFVVGSLAFDDWTGHSDIDVVAVVSEPGDPLTITKLRAAHERFTATRPGVVVDGPFVGWADLEHLPSAKRRAWVLDGRFHCDDGCFELNPVTWHVLATDAISLRGSRPTEIDVDGGALRAWVMENLHTYWASVADQIRDAVGSAPRDRAFSSSSLEWAVLGAARMLFTYEEGGVTSKTGAGNWAAERLVAHRDTFRTAVRARGEPTDIDGSTLLSAAGVIDAVISEVDRG